MSAAWARQRAAGLPARRPAEAGAWRVAQSCPHARATLLPLSPPGAVPGLPVLRGSTAPKTAEITSFPLHPQHPGDLREHSPQPSHPHPGGLYRRTLSRGASQGAAGACALRCWAGPGCAPGGRPRPQTAYSAYMLMCLVGFSWLGASRRCWALVWLSRALPPRSGARRHHGAARLRGRPAPGHQRARP